jgi:transposase-like protein
VATSGIKCPFCKSDRIIGVATATDNYNYCCSCQKRWSKEDETRGDFTSGNKTDETQK